MPKDTGEHDSSDSEKNFGDQVHHDAEPNTSKHTDDEFMDDDDEATMSETEESAAQIGARTTSNFDDEAWKSSFDVDQLHQLRELYNTRQKQTEEEDEQKLFDALKERNTDELKSLRQATAVLEKFESQPYVEEPVTSNATKQRRIRPQRFLAGAGRYANKLLKQSKDLQEDEEDEGVVEGEEKPMEVDDKDLLAEALGGKTQVKKHKQISREVAKLRFSNPGTAFIDHFNLDDEGGASVEMDYSQRSSRKAKVHASDRLRVTGTRARSDRQAADHQFSSPQRSIVKPVIYHNQNGEIVVNGEVVANLCDCLQDSCPGCFFGCPDCGSNKCGPLCRRQRQQFAYCVAEPRQKTIQPIRYNPFRAAIRRSDQNKFASPEKCL